MRRRRLLLTALLLHKASLVFATFSFNVTSPTNQCDPLTVTWTGGQSPFTIEIIPIGQTSSSVTVPDGTTGTYTIHQLANVPLAPGNGPVQLVVAMGDATGNFSGGVSNILTVGASTTGATCDSSNIGTSFYFGYTSDQSSTLAQCSDQTVTFYPGDPGIAQLPTFPVTLNFFTVGGAAETLTIPLSAVTYDQGDNPTWKWLANLTSNTQIVSTATDALKANGGTSMLQTVVSTGDTSCLNAVSTPSSTPAPAKSLPTGVLVGIIIGGLVGIAIIIILLFLLSRTRRRSRGVSAYIDDEPVVGAPQDGPGIAMYPQQPHGSTPFMLHTPSDTGGQASMRPYSNASSSDGQRRPDSGLLSDYSKGSQSIMMPPEQAPPEELPPIYQDFGNMHRPVDAKASYQAPLANYASTSQVDVGSSSHLQPQASTLRVQNPQENSYPEEEEFNPYI